MDLDEDYMNYTESETSDDEDDDTPGQVIKSKGSGSKSDHLSTARKPDYYGNDNDEDLGIALVDESPFHSKRLGDDFDSSDEFSQEILSQDDIGAHINNIIGEVTGVMQVNE